MEGGPRCACGQGGCVDAVCGAWAVLEKAKAVLPFEILRAIGKAREELTWHDLISEPLVNTPQMQELMEETSRIVGRVISNLVHLLNPELVVLGGELSGIGESLCQVVREEVLGRSLEEMRSSLSVEISRIKGSAPLMGAYVLALERIFALEEWGGVAAGN